MILSRVKPALGDRPPLDLQSAKAVPSLEQFLNNRDYTGAIVKLEFEESTGKGNEKTEEWIGYCAFHLGDYKKAMSIYEGLMRRPQPPPDAAVNLTCCYFFLGLYQQAKNLLDTCPDSRLKTRLDFHLAHKLNLESRVMELHQKLENVTEDMLSLAAIHYLRSSYQEAIDIYKRILLDNRIKSNEMGVFEMQFLDAISQQPQYIALNVYVALCYYKLDYFDVSQEVLATYLQKYPDSATALNLKACNYYKLENGKAAENELKALLEGSSSSFTFGQDIIKHNLVAFKGGIGALQVLPPLVDVIPEARLNLVIYYFRQGDYMEAYELIKNLEPAVPQEYILKAIVNASIGQETNSNLKNADGEPLQDKEKIADRLREYIQMLFKDKEMDELVLEKEEEDEMGDLILRVEFYQALKGLKRNKTPGINNIPSEILGDTTLTQLQFFYNREQLKAAQQFFQLVGNSVSECDTIPGRQCMASAFFLQRQFDDVLIYLSSIKSYFYNDDSFNFNYAQAKSAMGNYKEAEEIFLMIQNEKFQNDYVFISHLARCYIMQGKAQLAWELYLKMETSAESLSLLQLVANDCYKMGEFYHAAKAFELLERLDPTPENWEGKRGACIGVFQLIVAGRQPTSLLPEIIQLLRHSTNSQVESIIRIIKRWAKERKINI